MAEEDLHLSAELRRTRREIYIRCSPLKANKQLRRRHEPNELLHDSHQHERTKARPGVAETSAPSAPLVVSGCYDSDKDGRSGGGHGQPGLRYLSHERRRCKNKSAGRLRLNVLLLELFTYRRSPNGGPPHESGGITRTPTHLWKVLAKQIQEAKAAAGTSV